jgi:hypothetical protein
VNCPFFGPEATWHFPFLSFTTFDFKPAAAGLEASGHFMNLPLASLQGAAREGDAAIIPTKATAVMSLRIIKRILFLALTH